MARLSVVLVALLAVGCSGPTPSAAPTSTPAPTVAPSPTPTAAPPVLDFPDLSEQALAPGRYSSSPPFGMDFTFEVPSGGWESAHLHEEFFDIMQLDPGSTSPRRWIAWGLPTTVYGESDGLAADLTAEDAATLLAGNPFVIAGPTSPFEVDGLSGVRLDLTSNRAASVPLFGGPAGDFGLDQDHELRLGIIRPDDTLLFVLILAPNGELEAAWMESAPIVASMDLAGDAP